MLQETNEILCFTIENIRFAICLSCVDRVIRALEVTPVPNAPLVIMGVFDYHGSVVPVINMRHRLKMTDQPVRINDVFILADTSRRKLALVADKADGIVKPTSNELIKATDLDSGFEAKGVLRRDDGIILIYDIEQFLSAQEELDFQEAIDKHCNYEP
ncbi:MAG: chemotaxis protein CheW [Bacteroidales bacterium]